MHFSLDTSFRGERGLDLRGEIELLRSIGSDLVWVQVRFNYENSFGT